MRYGKGHREETRRHIIDVAARRFREDGVAAAGIAGLMADAGLTNGAFYTHFTSKEDLVRQALQAVQENTQGTTVQALKDGAPPEVWLRRYLSPQHRDNPGAGCVAAALSAEIARHPEETRDIFRAGYEKFVGLIAATLPIGTPAERRAKAQALYGLMIGTLQLARAVGKGPESDEILDNGVKAGLVFISSVPELRCVTAP
ncbi:TetR/AcrR family transcriptional regulator [Gluconacetobacter tumulicola]|uniref:TetR/AcrR family transcriptional regulator n=1 Tax=Gluconacetobacter tumulicola TaxID=1017177 RepID=A0A7W4JFQ1_9PROT|nr:TetR/AcrR family transcriptional regulator [Gluconacetobacter tumulicola]MBB2180229.1 TetR/AcrR family transcriptional regulator [Gluconacetobacter tumulicola]